MTHVTIKYFRFIRQNTFLVQPKGRECEQKSIKVTQPERVQDYCFLLTRNSYKRLIDTCRLTVRSLKKALALKLIRLRLDVTKE
ncbi:Uncharacterized protein APZ42_000078 [Daphnia magna]|uniref:Uncharacterized protein n=1 Tax=Daphnia magna TaxID=35525 RepID=A0A164JXQ0_9CRUS|nr:Uncharacterized protein APZ42_000078 [Daphnia magna]